MDITHIFFDLDGTLIDPAEGITRCMHHALMHLGVPSPPVAELARFIGPPLRESFAELLADNPGAARVERAVGLYRERFVTAGIFENSVYPGIGSLLASLHEQGIALYVVTSKPHVFAVRICEHFGLRHYFNGVYGPELNGRFDSKGELLEHLLVREGIAPQRALMVGDRKHDVIAAKKHDITAVGVTWGYGLPEELRAAGADMLCRTPEELLECLVWHAAVS